MEKLCIKCKRILPFESFYKDKSRQDGRYPWCKDCKEAARKRGEYRRDEWLFAKYGIVDADYLAMVVAQDNRCALCGKIPVPCKTKKPLYIDHDHKTGKVRALLCTHCNVGLGMFQEDPSLLERAILYLKEHACE